MAREITEEDWPARVTDEQIIERVGGQAFLRGRRYADEGRVLALSVSGGGDILMAQVRGSNGRAYQSMLYARRHGDRTTWTGSCSCPVSSDCKHTAAVLLAARAEALAGQDDGPADWEKELAGLLRVSEPDTRAMALEVAEVPRPGWPGDSGLTLLPLVEGKRGWNRQGAAWNQVLGGSLRGEVADDVLRAVQEIGRMAPNGFYYAEDRVALDETPHRVWEVLRRGVAAGLVLTTSQKGGAAVRIESGLRAGVRLARTGEGGTGDLSIEPMLELEAVPGVPVGPRGEAPELRRIGGPVHGFYTWCPDGSLLLMPVEPAPDEVLARVLSGAARPIVVPEADVERFQAENLEALTRAVPVLEVDAGLAVPEPTSLRAVLRITVVGQAHTASTSWWMRYVTADGEVRREEEIGDLDGEGTGGFRPLPGADGARPGRAPEGPGWASADAAALADDPRARVADGAADGGGGATSSGDRSGSTAPGPEGPGTPRDLAGERRLARDVITLLIPLAAEHGVLWNRRRLTGIATAKLVARTVPALERLDAFDVELLGDVPAYREAEETPLVVTDVAEDRGGRPDWFSLQVRVRVGEDDIPLERLMQAVATNTSEVMLDSGVWVNVDRPELIALARLMEEGRDLEDPAAKGSGAMQVTPFQAGYYQELVRLGVVGEQTRRWREGVGRLLEMTAPGAGRRSAPPEDAAADGDRGDGADGTAGRGADAGTGAADAVVGTAEAEASGAAAPTDPTDPTAVPAPAGLLAELRPYQLDGYRWLHLLRSTGLGGVLADDMGLGKTVQVLAEVQRTVEERAATPGGPVVGPEGHAPVLVVAPTSVVCSWVEQAARFTPGLRVAAVTRTAAKRGRALAEIAAEADVVVTSYTIARLDEEEMTGVDFSWVVLDEAQFVKNHTSATYRAVRRLRTPSTVAITGTPMENSLMDLWSLMSVSAPGLLPGPERFTAVYKRPIDRGSSAALAALRARVHPFMLRRTKDQVAGDLPEKTEQVLSVELAPAHRRAYEQRLSRERQKVMGLLEDDTTQARFTALKSLTTLRLMALDPALVMDEERAPVEADGASDAPADVASAAAGHRAEAERTDGGPADKAGAGKASARRRKPTAKVQVLLDQLGPVVAEGHKALVFSQFTRYLSGVREELEAAGMRTAYLDGTTSNRQGVIDSFRVGEADVFLISLKAGGFGLTLTEADYVFLLDPWWNPQAEEQAVDRAHRIGQDKPVMVYRLVSEGTIEEKVMALKEKKAELFERVVEGSDDDVHAVAAARGARSRAQLTAAEIRELLGG